MRHSLPPIVLGLVAQPVPAFWFAPPQRRHQYHPSFGWCHERPSLTLPSHQLSSISTQHLQASSPMRHFVASATSFDYRVVLVIKADDDPKKGARVQPFPSYQVTYLHGLPPHSWGRSLRSPLYSTIHAREVPSQ